jgi:cell division protein FtsB
LVPEYAQLQNFRLTLEAKAKFTENGPGKAKHRGQAVGFSSEAQGNVLQTNDWQRMIREESSSKIRRLPSAQDGLRAIAERLPQAKAKATSWLGHVRPLLTQVHSFRRRIATVTVMVLAALLFLHVVFGSNGMVVYKRKRAEYVSLQKRIIQEQKENDLYTQQIQGLKTDEKAIEKEAREQLRYVRPGEYVYVPPAPASAPPVNHSAKK